MLVPDTLGRVLERVPAVRLAVLFGSAANGTARPDSDLDVGVLLDPDDDGLPALRVDLERAAGRVVDLVSLRETSPLLRFEIARDGRLLTARDPGAWAHFRARAMIDWWDWAPTASIMRHAMRVRLDEEAGHGQP